jgi:hypothetical protein
VSAPPAFIRLSGACVRGIATSQVAGNFAHLDCSAHSRYAPCDRTAANNPPYSLKVGRVVIITRGRYAGKKCVIISPLDNGTKSHPFPHALVAGIERYPSKVTRRMSKTKQAKKSKVKPFVKQVNCTWP